MWWPITCYEEESRQSGRVTFPVAYCLLMLLFWLSTFMLVRWGCLCLRLPAQTERRYSASVGPFFPPVLLLGGVSFGSRQGWRPRTLPEASHSPAPPSPASAPGRASDGRRRPRRLHSAGSQENAGRRATTTTARQSEVVGVRATQQKQLQ